MDGLTFTCFNQTERYMYIKFAFDSYSMSHPVCSYNVMIVFRTGPIFVFNVCVCVCVCVHLLARKICIHIRTCMYVIYKPNDVLIAFSSDMMINVTSSTSPPSFQIGDFTDCPLDGLVGLSRLGYETTWLPWDILALILFSLLFLTIAYIILVLIKKEK